MLSDIIKTNSSDIYSSVISRYVEDSDNKTNRQLISEIYNILKKDYRNEYFYKNTILNEILIKLHKVESTIALTEIPVSNSIADIIMINGVPKVYEIKTELDNFYKLEGQINDYYKAFEYVSVVTSESNIDKLKEFLQSLGNWSYSKCVGIYYIDSDSNLKLKKSPKSYKGCLDKKTMFQILRKKEYETILQNMNLSLPKVSQFHYYSECLNLFSSQPIEKVYNEFFSILKTRSVITNEELKIIPEELREVVYFSKVKQVDYDKLQLFLNALYTNKKERA